MKNSPLDGAETYSDDIVFSTQISTHNVVLRNTNSRNLEVEKYDFGCEGLTFVLTPTNLLRTSHGHMERAEHLTLASCKT